MICGQDDKSQHEATQKVTMAPTSFRKLGGSSSKISCSLYCDWMPNKKLKCFLTRLVSAVLALISLVTAQCWR